MAEPPTKAPATRRKALHRSVSASGSSSANLTLTQAYNLAREDGLQSGIDSTPTQQPAPPIRPLPQRVEQLAGSPAGSHVAYATPTSSTAFQPSTSRRLHDEVSEIDTPTRGGQPIPPTSHQPVTPATFALPPSPQTPRTQRMVDRVGEEFKGNLPYILGELKRALEALLPAKDQSKRHISSLAPHPVAEQATNLTFKCERSGFLNALNMVDYCQRLANKPPPPTSNTSGFNQLAESITKCLQTSLSCMEGKIADTLTDALTEQTLQISSTLAKAGGGAVASQAQKSFAQAAAQPGNNGVAKQPKSSKPKQAPPPPPYFLSSS